jgi:membrane-associated phospholipid phosphatase
MAPRVTPMQTVDATAPGRVRAITRRPVVYGVLLGYAVLSTILMLVHAVGVTSEHALLIVLVLSSLIATTRPFVWDWLPFLGVGVMFSDLGTLIGKKIVDAHLLAPILAERHILGGNVAAVWLQEHLRVPLPWLDVPTAVVYLTFFAAPVLFGVWLWTRHRDRFGTYVAAYIAMMAVGFFIYVLYPETPPWLAAKDGLLPHVDRITVDLLNHLGRIGHLYAGADPAPYGAMPSLHVAVPMLIACTVMGVRGWNHWIWWLCFLYPLAMAFATLYLGEHYLLDDVAGMALAVLCYLIAALWSARDRRHATPASMPEPRATRAA